MKNLILLFFFSFSLFCNNTFSQSSQRIKSVNIQEIFNSINNEIIEKGYDTEKAFQFRDSLGQKMVNQFQSDYNMLFSRTHCNYLSQKQMKEQENQLIKIQKQLQSFEKESLRILEQNQLERSQNILFFTKNKIYEYGKKHHAIILSTDVILFQNNDADNITSTLLKHIHQSEDYNGWIDSFDKTEELIQQIEELDHEITPIFKVKD